ncbi:hypothetical protein H0H92_013523 [Tricholoma furcatifolium]|nr:hypothetical protein H0H92_013523 [Tricholoma furcatifolium]
MPLFPHPQHTTIHYRLRTHNRTPILTTTPGPASRSCKNTPASPAIVLEFRFELRLFINLALVIITLCPTLLPAISISIPIPVSATTHTHTHNRPLPRLQSTPTPTPVHQRHSHTPPPRPPPKTEIKSKPSAPYGSLPSPPHTAPVTTLQLDARFLGSRNDRCVPTPTSIPPSTPHRPQTPRPPAQRRRLPRARRRLGRRRPSEHWAVAGPANERIIHVFSPRSGSGVLVRTLVGHEAGVWGFCLLSAGGVGVEAEGGGGGDGDADKENEKGKERDGEGQG